MPSQTFVRDVRHNGIAAVLMIVRPDVATSDPAALLPVLTLLNVARRTDKPGKEHGLLLCDVLIATSLRGHSPANVSLRISDLSRSSLDAQ